MKTKEINVKKSRDNERFWTVSNYVSKAVSNWLNCVDSFTTTTVITYIPPVLQCRGYPRLKKATEFSKILNFPTIWKKTHKEKCNQYQNTSWDRQKQLTNKQVSPSITTCFLYESSTIVNCIKVRKTGSTNWHWC